MRTTHKKSIVVQIDGTHSAGLSDGSVDTAHRIDRRAFQAKESLSPRTCFTVAPAIFYGAIPSASRRCRATRMKLVVPCGNLADSDPAYPIMLARLVRTRGRREVTVVHRHDLSTRRLAHGRSGGRRLTGVAIPCDVSRVRRQEVEGWKVVTKAAGRATPDTSATSRAVHAVRGFHSGNERHCHR